MMTQRRTCPFLFLTEHCTYPYLIEKQTTPSFKFDELFEERFNRFQHSNGALQSLQSLFVSLCNHVIQSDLKTNMNTEDELRTAQAPQCLLDLSNFVCSTFFLNLWGKQMVMQALTSIPINGLFPFSTQSDTKSKNWSPDTSNVVADPDAVGRGIYTMFEALFSGPLSFLFSSENINFWTTFVVGNKGDKDETMLRVTYALLRGLENLFLSTVESLVHILCMSGMSNEQICIFIQRLECFYSNVYAKLYNRRTLLPFFDIPVQDPLFYLRLCFAERMYYKQQIQCQTDTTILDSLHLFVVRKRIVIRGRHIAIHAVQRALEMAKSANTPMQNEAICTSVRDWITTLVFESLWNESSDTIQRHIIPACQLLTALKHVPPHYRPDHLAPLDHLPKSVQDLYTGDSVQRTSTHQVKQFVRITDSLYESSMAFHHLLRYVRYLHPYWQIELTETADVLDILCCLANEGTNMEGALEDASIVAIDGFHTLCQFQEPAQTSNSVSPSPNEIVSVSFWDYIIQACLTTFTTRLSTQDTHATRKRILIAMLDTAYQQYYGDSPKVEGYKASECIAFVSTTKNPISTGMEEWNSFAWCWYLLTCVAPSSYNLTHYMTTHIYGLIAHLYEMTHRAGAYDSVTKEEERKLSFVDLECLYAELKTMPMEDLYCYVTYPIVLQHPPMKDQCLSASYACFVMEYLKPFIQPFEETLYWESNPSVIVPQFHALHGIDFTTTTTDSVQQDILYSLSLDGQNDEDLLFSKNNDEKEKGDDEDNCSKMDSTQNDRRRQNNEAIETIAQQNTVTGKDSSQQQTQKDIPNKTVKQHKFLIKAARYGNLSEVRRLLPDSDVDKPGGFLGATPLCAAAMYGHLDVVQYLVETGEADCFLMTKNGTTPLLAASYYGYYDIVEYLAGINDGQEVNWPLHHTKKSALWMASYLGYTNIVQYLATKTPADLNQRSYHEQLTPLFAASQEGHHEIVQHLLSWNCVIVDAVSSSNGRTPFGIAALQGHTQVVRCFLEQAKTRPNINHSDIYGETPLYLASKRGHLTIVQLLVEQPDIIVDPTQNSGTTPLHIAALSGHTDIVKYLIKTGNANVDNRASQGETLLFLASCSNNIDTVRCVLEQTSIGPCIARNDGMTCLDMACMNGNRNIVRCLVEDAEAYIHTYSIQLAIKKGYTSIVKYLVTVGQKRDQVNVLRTLTRTNNGRYKNGRLTTIETLFTYAMDNNCRSIFNHLLVSIPTKSSLECYLTSEISLCVERMSARTMMLLWTFAALGLVPFHPHLFRMYPLQKVLHHEENSARLTQRSLVWMLMEIAARCQIVSVVEFLKETYKLNILSLCQPIPICDDDQQTGLNVVPLTLYHLRQRDWDLIPKDNADTIPPLFIFTQERVNKGSYEKLVQTLLPSMEFDMLEKHGWHVYVVDDPTYFKHEESDACTNVNDHQNDVSSVWGKETSNKDPQSDVVVDDTHNDYDIMTGSQTLSSCESFTNNELWSNQNDQDLQLVDNMDTDQWYRHQVSCILGHDPWNDTSISSVVLLFESRLWLKRIHYGEKTIQRYAKLSPENDYTIHFTSSGMFGFSNLCVRSGQWYFEGQVVSDCKTCTDIGWVNPTSAQTNAALRQTGFETRYSWGYTMTLRKGSIFCCRIDIDDGILTFTQDGYDISSHSIPIDDGVCTGIGHVCPAIFGVKGLAIMFRFGGPNGRTPITNFDPYYRPMGEIEE